AAEEAEKGAHQIRNGSEVEVKSVMHKVNKLPKDGKKCFVCNKTGHFAKDCKVKSRKCFNCGKEGHFANSCRVKKPKGSGTVGRVNNQKVDRFEEVFMVPLKVNGVNVKLELDTGASKTLVSEEFWRNKLGSPKLKSSSTSLRTYCGTVLKTLGEVEVNVEYGRQKATLPLVVIKGNGTALFGRNWMSDLKLDFEVLTCNSVRTDSRLADLLKKYQDLFKDELGTVKGFEAKIVLREEAKPKFCKARQIPLALKNKVEKELERLEKAEIIEKVSYSDWASPIVVVPKPDGSVRICGDFKQTVNPQLHIEQYPLPKPDDVMLSLAGGQRFSNLDMRDAYFQLKLDEESKKYCVINTPK
ncbi:hypothetical protein B4U79_13970, partial [Dinothrombium tinctorium]